MEWLFGDIINYFCFLDFKNNLKIGLSQIGKMYIVCALLRNALTWLYGNTTSQYLPVVGPTHIARILCLISMNILGIVLSITAWPFLSRLSW